MPSEGARREEILQTAGTLFASSGLRTSLNEIADAAGILPGSLYHHFESKEAILVELVRRYYADLDRIGEIAHEKLDQADPRLAADVVLRSPECKSGTRRTPPKPTNRRTAGNAANAARG